MGQEIWANSLCSTFILYITRFNILTSSGEKMSQKHFCFANTTSALGVYQYPKYENNKNIWFYKHWDFKLSDWRWICRVFENIPYIYNMHVIWNSILAICKITHGNLFQMTINPFKVRAIYVALLLYQVNEWLLGKILYMFLSSDGWPSFMEFGTNDNGRLNNIIMNEGIWYIMKSKLKEFKI